MCQSEFMCVCECMFVCVPVRGCICVCVYEHVSFMKLKRSFRHC